MEATKCTIENQSQVATQNVKLSQKINLLTESIETLTDRLSPVLRAPHPINDDEECERESLVNLAEELFEKTERVEVLIKRVQSAIDRLEL